MVSYNFTVHYEKRSKGEDRSCDTHVNGCGVHIKKRGRERASILQSSSRSKKQFLESTTLHVYM